MKKEHEFSPISGYLALFVIFLFIVPPILAIIFVKMIWMIALILLGIFFIAGLVTVNPK